MEYQRELSNRVNDAIGVVGGFDEVVVEEVADHGGYGGPDQVVLGSVYGKGSPSNDMAHNFFTTQNIALQGLEYIIDQTLQPGAVQFDYRVGLVDAAPMG